MMIMNYLPAVAVRAHEPGARVQEVGQGLRRRARFRSSRSRSCRSEGSRPKTSGRPADDDVDAAFRRPPAAPPRTDPSRALDPRLPVDQSPSRAGPPRPCSASVRPPAPIAEVRAPVRPRPADLRAVLGLPEATASGDLGQSIASRRSVTSEIRQRFPATLQLAIVAMIFALGVGLPLGFLAAKWHGGVRPLIAWSGRCSGSPSRSSSWR